jgi:hypothetical protein
MKVQGLFLIGVLVTGLFAETIVKNSKAFSFPATVGTRGGNVLQSKEAIFAGSANLEGRKIITLSWSLPVKASTGSIAIFTLSGAKIKFFQISSPQGYVNWDVSGAGRTGNGIYFATLSYGSIHKNLKLMFCR